jgi:choline dehydrogenase-like flavoprotein
MAYVRGNKEDYNSWENLGNKGWGYNDVLPYFKKSEKTNVPNLDPKYHSTEGIWSNHHPIWKSELVDAWLKSGDELGYGTNPDYNGEKQEGISLTQQSITPDGKRASTSCFVYPFVKKRPNFHLITQTQVNRVLFEGKKAIGVEIQNKNGVSIIKANKEVIVSAGSINTPKLLMLSGIGPKDELKRLDIPLLADLPVGKNLQDHPQFGVEFNVSLPSLTLDVLNSPWTAIKYFLFHKNELAQSLLFGSGFFSTKGNKNKYPDIQMHFIPLSTNCEIYENFMGAYANLCNPKYTAKNGMAFVTVLLHEKSVGSVTLKNKDPNEKPLIDLNFFDHPDDMKTLIDGIRIVERIANSTTFKGINNGLKKVDWNPHPEYTEPYWKMMVEYWGNHLFHPVGTCKMGPKGDKSAVVDSSNLKVNGIESLRVIDASVMPHIVSGNTAAASVLIGEKGSDMIKSEWKL